MRMMISGYLGPFMAACALLSVLTEAFLVHPTKCHHHEETRLFATTTTTTTTTEPYKAPATEIERRRNLAIISHPDSGKTTMTEKLLLYGGALQQAGAVRQKAEQRATQSDFMEMEQERGISISSTVMNFDYNGLRVNILDTPGHQDFSEDTYRALAAADNAVMLLDAAKGLEPQTRKLFEVCRLRNLPLFTFVNKMDRPALTPYEIMDQIEAEFGLETHPILWPIGDGDRFKGVLDRTTNIVHLYTKPTQRGGKAEVQEVPMEDEDTLKSLIDDQELFDKLLEDQELLQELIPPLDMERVMAATQSPLFFGSAMTNFGVQLFLDKFCDMGTKPMGRLAADKQEDEGEFLIAPEHQEFTGFVFKTQANLDPKHRDRLAYVRVVSGVYEKGMKVGHSRSKPAKKYNLAQAQALFGSDRTTVELAYPGDVIGINNPGNFAIGDTLYTGNSKVAFPGIPSFSPEKFAYIRSPNPSDYKSFRKGMDQLLDEGAIQALRQRNDDGGGPLMLAAVGQLQFEVVQARLKNEYNVDSLMEPLSYTLARWVDGGWDAVDKADADGKLFGIMVVQDRWKRPVLLFRNDWKAASLAEEEKYLELKPWSQPPDMDD
ncbi:Peptide chain release factor 3 [Seminavis robusta]|uniref:Peptide chain release factor 3 n=1 Tax=Seminavis robusta TaxID=568900 RepID=A0A9N8E4J9_9STRA|nr:Peptide chain release factor 3 [Seminavis robusta]|eukprot:Sro543_g163470.1 Peptide chain release factor 3 (604) ;mRNA; r:13626-15636